MWAFSIFKPKTIAKISIDRKSKKIILFGEKVEFNEKNLRGQLGIIKKIYELLKTIEKIPLDRKNSEAHKLIFLARKGNLQKILVGENWQVLNCISLDFKNGSINIHLNSGSENKCFSFSEPKEMEECLAMLSTVKKCEPVVIKGKKKIFLSLKNLKRKNLEKTENNNIDNILDESNN